MQLSLLLKCFFTQQVQFQTFQQSFQSVFEKENHLWNIQTCNTSIPHKITHPLLYKTEWYKLLIHKKQGLELFCYFNLVNRQFKKYWKQVYFSGDCAVPVQNNIDQSMLWDSVHIYTFTSVSSNSRYIYWSQLYFYPLFPGFFVSLNLKTKIRYYFIFKNYEHNLYILMSKCPQLGRRCLLLDTVILRYMYQLFNRTACN